MNKGITLTHSKEVKTYILYLVIVSLGAIFWSLGPIVVRKMISPELYRWQYLFFRGLTIAALMTTYLLYSNPGILFEKKLRFPEFIGAAGLATAMTSFIYSITITTSAVTMFMLALTPLITSLLSRVILGERISKSTLYSILGATFGCVLMAADEFKIGSLLGLFLGFLSSLGFAGFTVSLRWNPDIPKRRVIILAGLICSVFALLVLLIQSKSIAGMPLQNIGLSSLHGFLVGLGLILYSIGAKYLSAADLSLMVMIEVVGGIVWVSVPWFGIGEPLSLITLLGGGIILTAIMIRAIKLR